MDDPLIWILISIIVIFGFSNEKPEKSDLVKSVDQISKRK